MSQRSRKYRKKLRADARKHASGVGTGYAMYTLRLTAIGNAIMRAIGRPAPIEELIPVDDEGNPVCETPESPEEQAKLALLINAVRIRSVGAALVMVHDAAPQPPSLGEMAEIQSMREGQETRDALAHFDDAYKALEAWHFSGAIPDEAPEKPTIIH